MKGFGRSSALRHDNDSIRTFAERHDERESRGADAAMCGETTPVRDPPYPEMIHDLRGAACSALWNCGSPEGAIGFGRAKPPCVARVPITPHLISNHRKQIPPR
jgi:hypothetical protein